MLGAGGRKSAKASPEVLDRLTPAVPGTVLNGSVVVVQGVVVDQAEDDPKGSRPTSVGPFLTFLTSLTRLLAEKGSKESSRLLLWGTLGVVY